MKICYICKKEKSYELFYNRLASKDGKMSRCKDCDRIERRKRRWKPKNESPESYRNRRLKARFGITIQDYDRMNEEQKGLCAICHKPQRTSGFHEKLLVDHCHTKNKVRQLLCMPCNAALGLFKEDIVILQSAINYLEKHKEN